LNATYKLLTYTLFIRQTQILQRKTQRVCQSLERKLVWK